jgi:hypothetical protein
MQNDLSNRPLISLEVRGPDSHAMQVDRGLRRTVIMSTKFDTRLKTFSASRDIELFLWPSEKYLDPNVLGGSPFFT